jgi:trehalose 6-phosphate synthase
MIDGQSRLIIVSNRVASPRRDGSVAAGGLAVALRDALRERHGLWFGWSGELSEAPSPKPRIIEKGGSTYALIDLTPEERDRYYTGFANRMLWPLMHYRLSLVDFSREDYAGYLAVNERFAEVLLPMLRATDLVWIHDYHLIPLASMLRKLGYAGRIGYFHHIPWPPPEVFGALPSGAELLDAIMDYDLVGLQTAVDARNLLACLAECSGVATQGDRAFRNAGGVTVRSFPIGIDAKNFSKLAARAFNQPLVQAAMQQSEPTRFIIGIDRLDYSKGIVPRMLAFERFIERHPEHRQAVSLLQIAPPSRIEVPEYMELDRQTDETAGRINAALAELDWTPIRVIKKTYSQGVLSGLMRRSAIGLVTPVRDGMNLVAKEYVAAQDPQDPGVLILSRFAGAARQLGAALMVNPFDLTEMADAVDAALAMPACERRSRHAVLLENVLTEDIGWWRHRYLTALAVSQDKQGRLSRF